MRDLQRTSMVTAITITTTVEDTMTTITTTTVAGTTTTTMADMAAAGLSPRRVDMSTTALIIAVSSTAVLIVSNIFLELHIPELRIGEIDRLSFMLDAYIAAMI